MRSYKSKQLWMVCKTRDLEYRHDYGEWRIVATRGSYRPHGVYIDVGYPFDPDMPHMLVKSDKPRHISGQDGCDFFATYDEALNDLKERARYALARLIEHADTCKTLIARLEMIHAPDSQEDA